MHTVSAAAALVGIFMLVPSALTIPVETNIETGAGAEANNDSTLALDKRGYFKGSCESWALGKPYWSLLTASCKKSNGEFRQAWLDLSSCLVNHGGQLWWGENGQYSGSCDIYSGGITGTAYFVNCKDWGGNWVRASIDLDENIGNNDGYLQCYGGHGW